MRVSELMATPIKVPQDMCVATIATLFLEGEATAVVVADHAGEPLGIVTERDIEAATGRSDDLDAIALTPVERIMRPFSATVQEDEEVEDAVAQMARFEVNNVPVLRGGQLVGILCRHDARRRSAVRPAPRTA